ncbi:MAG: hypothetical protein AABX85_02795 [Nanoarchaeota archaeon]
MVEEKNQNLIGIKGWLLLFVILSAICVFLLGIIQPLTILLLGALGGESVSGYVNIFVLVSMLSALFFLVFFISALLKKRWANKMAITAFVFSLFSIPNYIFTFLIYGAISSPSDYEVGAFSIIIRSLFGFSVFLGLPILSILYFLRSKRVKNTFVR